MSVVEELRIYYTNPENESIKKYIKGLNPNTNKILLENESGVRKEVSMEELKSNLFDFEKFELKEEILEENDFEMIEEIDEPKQENVEMIEEIKETYTMQDLKNAATSKDIVTIDKILATFAVNPNTGLIDIDRAIGLVTKNTVDLSIDCINQNKKFETDLNKFSADGKLIKEKVEEKANEQSTNEILESGFSNIMVLVEVARQKGIVYSEENIQRAKKIFSTQVKDGLNIKNLESNNVNKLPQQEPKEAEGVKEEKSYVPTLKPNTDIKKAGFADIFILTIIVLVYAAIIVNLIMKLK